MSSFQGFLELKTPTDLLEKMRRDLARMEKNPADSDAAFDFFVAAEHMLDWKYPDAQDPKNREVRKKLHQAEPVLGMTWDLASGAKHFEATAPGHESVASLRIRPGFFDPAFFDSAFFDAGSLDIGTKPSASSLGSEITALDLAKRVLQYWEAHLGPPQLREVGPPSVVLGKSP